MTYNVVGGTLTITQPRLHHCKKLFIGYNGGNCSSGWYRSPLLAVDYSGSQSLKTCLCCIFQLYTHAENENCDIECP